MDFLLENSGLFESGEWSCPYWMVYKSEKVQGNVLEFLEQSQGYLIRHNGFDEVLYLLGAAFDYKLLAEEEFLKDAHNDVYRFNLGNTLEKLKKYEEALSNYQTAAALNPEDARWHESYGNLLKKLGRHEEAEQEKKKAEKLKKSSG